MKFPSLTQAARLGGLALLWLWAGLAWGVSIQVQADRDPVRLDESFQLIFSADGEPDGGPDFSPLSRDFEIHSENQSSQFTFSNGHSQRSIRWTLGVMAKRAGTLAVPPIAFGSDSSPPWTLHVESGGIAGQGAGSRQGNDQVFIEVDAEPKNPYVQAQVLYTVRLFSQVHLANARLEEPKLDNAVIERLTEDKQYQTQRRGQLYNVVERHFAVFPQQSGRLAIEPPVLDAEAGLSANSLFSRFFNQPGAERIRVRGQPVELAVRPIPARFSGKHWLPARSLSLEESLAPNASRINAGEPLTRTLILKAEGSTVGNLPELGGGAAPTGLSAYPDQPVLNETPTPAGLAASREEKIAYIPAQAGHYELPQVDVNWWNTETDREEIARVQPHAFSAAGTGAPAATPVLPDVSATPAATTPVPDTTEVPSALSSWLIGLATFFALGWLATAMAWWRSRRRMVPRAVATSAAPSSREQLRALRQACRTRDPKAARQALLDWAQAHWPEDPPRHLDDAARRAGGSLAQEIAVLNKACYSPDTQAWDGNALLHTVESLGQTKAAPAGDRLEPLYKT